MDGTGMIEGLTRAARMVVGALTAGTLMAATPALADDNTGENELVAVKDRAATQAPGAGIAAGTGTDPQFQQLFARWNKTDGGLVQPIPQVSVPSRMPLEDARLSSGYGNRIHPVLGRRKGHKGVDLAAPTGTPIYATADGTVSRADWFSSYGQFISIEHGADMQTRYAHLSRMVVNEGDTVKKGELIGYVGSTGRSTGPHLHYEVRIAGEAVDPAPYMIETQAQRNFAMADGKLLGAGGE